MIQLSEIKQKLIDKQTAILEAFKNCGVSLVENMKHEFIQQELANKDINAIKIIPHPKKAGVHQIIVDKADVDKARSVVGFHRLQGEYDVKAAKVNAGIDESLDEGSVHVLIKKHQKDSVVAALNTHKIGHSSYPVDAQHHGIAYDKKDAAKIRTALTHFNPVDDNAPAASDKVRTTDFDKVQATAAKVKKRNDIQKALNRRSKPTNESWEEIETSLSEQIKIKNVADWKANAERRGFVVRDATHPQTGEANQYLTAKDKEGNDKGSYDHTKKIGILSEDVDVDAIKKLSAAIKSNPEIEPALFQLISAIMTNPKMFEANPTIMINKIAASSKVPAQKLQAVVVALGLC